MPTIAPAEHDPAPGASPATESPLFDPDMTVHFWKSLQARDAGCLPHLSVCADGTHRERDGGMPSGWWDRFRMEPLADGDACAMDLEEEACM
jgi:hypothetical protein